MVEMEHKWSGSNWWWRQEMSVPAQVDCVLSIQNTLSSTSTISIQAQPLICHPTMSIPYQFEHNCLCHTSFQAWWFVSHLYYGRLWQPCVIWQSWLLTGMSLEHLKTNLSYAGICTRICQSRKGLNNWVIHHWRVSCGLGSVLTCIEKDWSKLVQNWSFYFFKILRTRTIPISISKDQDCNPI